MVRAYVSSTKIHLCDLHTTLMSNRFQKILGVGSCNRSSRQGGTGLDMDVVERLIIAITPPSVHIFALRR